MQTGQLLANLLNISRQAVHAHFQSDNKDHGSWALTRIRENLTSKLHFHAGITPKARMLIVQRQIADTKTRWEAIQEAWGQFETTLRNGKRVTRQRDTKKAMQALADQMNLFDDAGWAIRMLRIAVKSVQQALGAWAATGEPLPTRAETRAAMKAITQTPLFMILGDPVPG